MAKYDDISPDRLRTDLVTFAQILVRLEGEDGLLESPGELQRLLGNLRQKLFEHEMRSSRFGKDGTAAAGEPSPVSRRTSGELDDRVLQQSLRVILEASRRREEMEQELMGAAPDDDEDYD